jgi:CBS domain-containing protein
MHDSVVSGSVAELLLFKGNSKGVVDVAPEWSVLEATRLMNRHAIGCVVVTVDNGISGIFTERDVLRRVVALGRPPESTSVECVMTRSVICCSPETAVEDVAHLMRARRVRHVPVVDGVPVVNGVPVVDGRKRIVGLVSIGDINARRAASVEVALHQLEDYLFSRA